MIVGMEVFECRIDEVRVQVWLGLMSNLALFARCCQRLSSVECVAWSAHVPMLHERGVGPGR